MLSAKAELQEVMDLLRRLKGSIEIRPDTEALDENVKDVVDKLFDAMKRMPD